MNKKRKIACVVTENGIESAGNEILKLFKLSNCTKEK
jgi:hypothetical protein